MKSQKNQTDKNSSPLQSQLFQAITAIQSVEEARQFLLDLCTPAELEAMADRLLVVAPIKQGLSYRQIHAQTGVSLTTIGRVARCIHFGTGGYDLIYQRLNNNSDKEVKDDR